MELTHRLTYNGTTTVIDEPIGFDDLKMTMKRHEYHGMGAEFSLGNLEFYGEAFNIIQLAYEADIDSEVLYEVLADGDTLYSGKIDLSTYSVKQADYQSVSVKVGEIGVKTTFNNRLDVALDLNTRETVDGGNLRTPDWFNVHIPKKSLLYTNRAEQTADLVFYPHWEDNEYEFVLNEVKVNEFGAVSEDGVQFFKTEGFDEKYGTGTTCSIDAYIAFNVHFSFGPDTIISDDLSGQIELTMSVGNRTLPFGIPLQITPSTMMTGDKLIELGIKSGDYPTDTIKLMIALRPFRGEYNGVITLTLSKSSYFKLTMYDNLPDDDVKTDMMFANDALKHIVEAISENELTLRSNWYGNFGDGALKAITNGYRIRNITKDRSLSISYKDLIKSLDALDCIGWGFSEEGGITCVRVERWDWFYKQAYQQRLVFENVAEVTTEVLTDRIFSGFSIGYKKYATADQYNSIESPHGTRGYAGSIKSVSQSKMVECDFVADNYAIEETRRARTMVSETTETTYDESIFVFELLREDNDYIITSTARNALNVGRANEFINAKLTPRQMAARWRDYLFSTNKSTPMLFKEAEINASSVFSVIPRTYTEDNKQYYSLRSYAETSPQREDADIPYTHAIFKAEKITFSYPLTIEEYNIVKDNPYGLIGVNGRFGWILEFCYSFADGMADFILLAKN